MNAELIDMSPVLLLAGIGLLLAGGPLLWLLRRHRHAGTPERLRALTLLALFLTFDLIVFGAYTRLSDSGLGCPDWPGCYGSVSPLGARSEIQAAQSAMPTGPVTHGKAWIEMIHRYLATGVGMLLIVLCAWTWRAARRSVRTSGHATAAISPGWATLSLFWVCLQGAFGALTVTMKLNPGIVTLHLLGGIGLLALLAVQAQRYTAGLATPGSAVTGDGLWPSPVALSAGLRRAVLAVLLLVIVQVMLGGWVSTHYAVLACTEFPTCQGRWWPEMDYSHAFEWRPALGLNAAGQQLSLATLTAIHMTHRLAAFVVLAAMLALGIALRRDVDVRARPYGTWLIALAAWQFVSGLSNVVLGWPLVAALAHTAGAAALVAVLAASLAASTRLTVPEPGGQWPSRPATRVRATPGATPESA
ncbi:COX15/CtaA family protein [Sphaerotilus mobilis]|uniref:Cytochrome c oxidase assembly protein subunit 15 n=1 Tax=Sphaerotilus mobilis TaxID=47994 RepID=A0A4Q7LK48_9BURK|nr:COX15/CtaA family protein [Sphaerotilus mobilis]RZS54502.1 cytochrome c oxidase assembly protein subunit 15 [Sphaerotilus mobilis]